MTNIANNPNPSWIAAEAQVEIHLAEVIEAADSTPEGSVEAFETTELGYYEAELRSLRDAATTLSEAEHPG